MHHISKTHIMEKRHEINTSKAPVFLFVLRISFMRSTVAANSFKPIFVRSVQVKYISVLTSYEILWLLTGKILKDVNRYINGGRDNFTFFFFFC